MGDLMGINPAAMRFAVLGVETIYRGVKRRSSCEVLHGIAVFTELKKHAEVKSFEAAFDLLMRTMDSAAPKILSQESEKEEVLYPLCFELPSLLRGINPSKRLVDFAQAYSRIAYLLSVKVKFEPCDFDLARSNLIKAKIALEDEWQGSKLAKAFLEKVVTSVLSSEPQ